MSNRTLFDHRMVVIWIFVLLPFFDNVPFIMATQGVTQAPEPTAAPGVTRVSEPTAARAPAQPTTVPIERVKKVEQIIQN